MKIGVAVLLFATFVTAKNPDATFNAVVVEDGKASDFIYNYLDPDGSGKYLWTMKCVQQPCSLFHKGDKVTVTVADKPQKVRVGNFRSEKFFIGRICGAPTGCFNSSISTGRK